MICIVCGSAVANGPFCSCCGAKQAAITLSQLYEDWKKIHFRRIGKKCMEGYEDAWKSLAPYENLPVTSITLEDYQAAMDSLATQSQSLQQKLRALIGQLCKFAIVRKIDQSNYSPFLVLDGYKSMSRAIFSDQEIARLFMYIKTGGKYATAARVILILIFTGLRPEELFEIKKSDVNFQYKYFVAKGSKTEAGRDRLIPIVAAIAPFVFSAWMTHRASPYLVTSPQGQRINLTNWRKREFYPLLMALGINTPDAPPNAWCPIAHGTLTQPGRPGSGDGTVAVQFALSVFQLDAVELYSCIERGSVVVQLVC